MDIHVAAEDEDIAPMDDDYPYSSSEEEAEEELEVLGGNNDFEELVNGYVSNYLYDFADRTLSKNITCLFNVPHLSDVTFLVPDENMPSKPLKPIFAHRFVLSSCSGMFRDFFSRTSSNQVAVTGVQFQHFLHIIRYIYVGWVEDTFPIREAGEFFRVVKCFGLENMFHWQLRTWLMNSARQRTESAVSIYITSYQHNFADVLRECLCAMTDIPTKTFEDYHFNSIPLAAMHRFVRCKRINCSKDALLAAVREWINENMHVLTEVRIQHLLQVVQNTNYRYKGKRYCLQLEPGLAASFLADDDTLIGDQIANIEVIQPDRQHDFKETCNLRFDESTYIYGVVIYFGKHKNHDERFVESKFIGQFEIRFGSLAIVNELFADEIHFREDIYKRVEIFFPKAVLNYNHDYSFEVSWRSIGAYPDVITFDVHRSNIRTDGNCFISELFIGHLYED